MKVDCKSPGSQVGPSSKCAAICPGKFSFFLMLLAFLLIETLTNRRAKIKAFKDDPLEEPYEAVCQCSSKGCKWEFKDKNPCEDITEITCPSPDFNLWPPEVTLTCAKENKELFYKD